ncbi:MAG: REP-associated tyrosine transposase [bacterium]
MPHTWDQGISANLTISIRRLPHFERGGSTYFVTFRTSKGTLTEQERQVVLEACYHWHGKRARFFAVVVMPDHVHMLLKPTEREDGVWHTLGEIMHSIKSFTAHEINKARGTKGSVWQDEWFDRIVRDAEEFDEKLGYIENNAVKAGLVAKPGEYKFLMVVLSEAAGVAGEDARPTGSGPAASGDARPTDTPPKVGRASPPAEPSEALEATPVAGNTISFHPERYAKTFKQWHDGIRDWCISRQLWWGHQVPVWSKPHPGKSEPPFSISEIKSKIEPWEKSGRLYWSPPPLGVIESQSDHICLRNPDDAEVIQFIEDKGFIRDPDVLDTWFSSALWPLSTMGWPSDTELLRAFNPSSTLCTAREIITLWVSRMVMFNRYLMPEGWGGRGGATPSVGVPEPLPSGRGNGPVPFKDVVIHAVIQDGEGRKMSKSLGNGIDPLDIIATHGSDAMRFILAQMATQTQDVRLPVEKDPTGRNTSSKFDLGKRLCNKLWNASRLALSKLPRDGQDANPPHPVHARDLSLVDRWMLARVVATTQAVDAALANYEFAQYATAVYDLLWRDFCDWYLEAIKPTIDNNPQQQAVLAHSLEVILRLAHPAMPYVTEAIWEQARQVRVAPIVGLHLPPARRDDLLCLAGWPEVDLHLRDAEAEGAFERLRQVVEAVREVRAAQQVHPKRKITLHTSPALVAEFHTAGALVPTLAGLGAVIGITDLVSFVAPHGSLKIRLLGEDAWLSDLADAVDAKAADAMTAKRIAELEKQHDTITARLNNPGYAQRAPAKLVEESKAQLQAIKAELAVLRG